jgi:hypothetical protein
MNPEYRNFAKNEDIRQNLRNFAKNEGISRKKKY